MNGYWAFIEALDVWLFRDNKPFTAQQNFVARGQFPPNPMTMQGVIRSYFLERELRSEGYTWDDYRNGNVSEFIINSVGLPGTEFGSLQMTGPFVAQRKSGNGNVVERLVRAPLDLLKNEDSGKYRLLKPAPSAKYAFKTSPPFENWRPLVNGGDGFKESNEWLTEVQFEETLNGNSNISVSTITDDAIFMTENRVGLALDYGRRANAESMFYRAEFVRPKDEIGLLVHINSTEIFVDTSGYINLGGESRSGRFSEVKQVKAFPQTGTGNVKIVLLTPAYFTEGWLPKNRDWSPWVGKNGKLVSVVVGKPYPISGWDMALNKPKPLRNYVPAGSVFFFENADVCDIAFTETPPNSPDYGAMGFGAFAVGKW